MDDERWADKAEWQQHLQGRLVTVGAYRNRAVCVSLVWATIRDKAVLFLEATSELVDWKMIDALVEVIAAVATLKPPTRLVVAPALPSKQHPAASR